VVTALWLVPAIATAAIEPPPAKSAAAMPTRLFIDA
jgi:hypothetical protein